MKSLWIQSTGTRLHLDPSTLLRGGEGSVYRLQNEKNTVAKIYHEVIQDRANKLNVMIHNPPNDPMATMGHHSIAWPKDLVVNENGMTVGFIMPLAEGSSAFSYLLPKSRKQQHAHANYRTQIRICRNIASAIEEIHSNGFAVGDLNMSNILVKKNALVTLIDCDSFEIRDPSTGKIYTCRVGIPDYTPPEHQNKNYASFNGGTKHDAFSMAVLFFQLLMEGMHPFSGSYKYGNGEANVAHNIKQKHWTYDPERKQEYKPRSGSPPFEMLDPHIQKLFIRCFRDGSHDPSIRPTANEWREELDTSELYLQSCSENKKHIFGEHLRDCPWCERKQLLQNINPQKITSHQITKDRSGSSTPTLQKNPSDGKNMAGAKNSANILTHIWQKVTRFLVQKRKVTTLNRPIKLVQNQSKIKKPAKLLWK
ncbi:helix-hairpin-helix domain-containing protein [Rhodohalobacter mucosus]|uniref:Protein kinase domain-containing protein n=1 Tax=Rhodohalobacter mucosus TaxID=2079485 RepID=A0A316TP39_9BACT|nr:protein kinase [Rhodohalobacter mucosus]PWN06367.1 hypothetical protein DDZ15_11135 [Rhodohalobacter mucosus]